LTLWKFEQRQQQNNYLTDYPSFKKSNIIMPSSSTLSLWKDYYATNKHFDSSNKFIKKMKDVSSPFIPFADSFSEISKNQGFAFLFLDPSETNLQLIRHSSVIGGDWLNPKKTLVAILGFEYPYKPIQIIQRSIKEIKTKSFNAKEFIDSFEDLAKFTSLKKPKQDFNFRNIIPIPNLLTQAFLGLEETDPYSVSKAFIETIYEYQFMMEPELINNEDPDQEKKLTDENDQNKDQDVYEDENQTHPDDKQKILKKQNNGNQEAHFDDLIHIIQFCHLCIKGKIPPVFYVYELQYR
jgi:hypothetical protein